MGAVARNEDGGLCNARAQPCAMQGSIGCTTRVPALAMIMCVGVTMLARAVAPERSAKFLRLNKRKGEGRGSAWGCTGKEQRANQRPMGASSSQPHTHGTALLWKLDQHLLVERKERLVQRVLQAVHRLRGAREAGEAEGRGGAKGCQPLGCRQRKRDAYAAHTRALTTAASLRALWPRTAAGKCSPLLAVRAGQGET